LSWGTRSDQGPDAATDVFVTDTLPVDTTFVSCSATGEGVCGDTSDPDLVDNVSTAIDWRVLNAHHVRLRAERAGSGPGRIYTIQVTRRDGEGLTTSAQLAVTVPKAGGR